MWWLTENHNRYNQTLRRLRPKSTMIVRWSVVIGLVISTLTLSSAFADPLSQGKSTYNTYILEFTLANLVGLTVLASLHIETIPYCLPVVEYHTRKFT